MVAHARNPVVLFFRHSVSQGIHSIYRETIFKSISPIIVFIVAKLRVRRTTQSRWATDFGGFFYFYFDVSAHSQSFNEPKLVRLALTIPFHRSTIIVCAARASRKKTSATINKIIIWNSRVSIPKRCANNRKSSLFGCNSYDFSLRPLSKW